MTLRALVYGCWLNHNFVRTRNLHQDAVLLCTTCGEEIPMLQSEVITSGPAREPAAVLGAASGKAKIVRSGKRITFPRQSER